MRKIFVGLGLASLVTVMGLGAPTGAQVDTSSTTSTIVTPGMVDALAITGDPVCTASGNWVITWTLSNVSTTAIGFIYAYSESSGGPYSLPVQNPLELDPIDPGASSVVVTTFPGGAASAGRVVLQTEAYFVPDTATGGPVGVQVDLPATCGGAQAAVETETPPSLTG